MNLSDADAVRVEARLGATATRLQNLLASYTETAAHNLSWELWERHDIRTDEGELMGTLLSIIAARLAVSE